MPRQKGKGKKRKRGWHRSKRSSEIFDQMLRKLNSAERRAVRNEQVPSTEVGSDIGRPTDS